MRLLGVIGWPIAHSRSPAMHNAALQHISADFVYLPFAVRPENLRVAIEGFRALGGRGLNVTIPHKEAALALCQPDELAVRVGAVNTLVFEDDGIIHGGNTDVHGFQMLMKESGAQSGNAIGNVIVLGIGGAARAVVAALSGNVTLVARRPRPFSLGGRDYEVQPWSALPTLLRDADLLVDATPRGLSDAPNDLDLSSTHAAVLDLVVRRETPLTRAARARGLRAATGTAMLLHQGAAAFERFTGIAAPLDVMRTALDSALETTRP
jgi:shikimate dehydrogenase